jgi:hypothetical protein
MANILTKAFDAVKNKVKKVLTIEHDTLYNYSDRVSRESTIAYLLTYAEGKRQSQVDKWKLYDDYYNNIHTTQVEYKAYCEKKNIPWIPAIIPDPYIHVESQIDTEIPGFEFVGRDDDLDSDKAKVRQYVCQYVLDQNEMSLKINRNQRRLNKLGNEIWKVGFDYNVELPRSVHGDIFVHDIDPANFINDPIALDIDDAEYHCYVYTIHRMKAQRLFRKELEKLGKTIDEIGTGEVIQTKIYSTDTYEDAHDTVQIVEHWFRQPLESSEKYTYELEGKEITDMVEWESGDIACSILINNTEIKYIPKYWLKTCKQNKMFPFSIGCKIPVENKFWDKSEIEPIKDLVDAADRELAIALLHDTYSANDVILMSEHALVDGSIPTVEPGAIWIVKDSATMKPARMGGNPTNTSGLKDTITYIRDIIKQTVGNFSINMGDAPPRNVDTLGGLIQMKEQGDSRQNKKKAGSVAMWERTLKLIDYTAIEFYDDNRLIFIGAEKSGETEQVQDENGIVSEKPVPVQFKYNSDYLKVYDDDTNAYYYPVIDTTINLGDGIKNSPAMTVQATENLMGANINPTNYKLANSLVDLMDLPNKKEIKENWEKLYANPEPPPVKEDKPNISISYKDLMPDAQVQLLAQIGIQSQGGVNPMSDGQMLPENEINPADILNQLTPEELQELEENPELLDNLLNNMAGGEQIG